MHFQPINSGTHTRFTFVALPVAAADGRRSPKMKPLAAILLGFALLSAVSGARRFRWTDWRGVHG